MADIQQQELVTKGLLQAFGTKCKKMFKLNPIHSYNDSNFEWIKIETSLLYNDSIQGFDDLYINIQGVTSEFNNNTKKVINSNFYVRANLNKVIQFAQGINLGTETIDALVLVKELGSNKLSIYLHLPKNRFAQDIIIDVIACHDEDLLFSVVEGVNYESDLSEPVTYEQIATSISTLPFSRAAIGDITIQLQEETAFTIIEDQATSNGITTITSSKSYPEYSTFAKIFKATQADRLSHELTFQYDWDNPIDSDDDAATITNGTFTSGSVVKIPIPNLLKKGVSTEEDTWATRVQVENGIVTAVDSTGGINLASTDSIGGIRLMDDTQTSIGDKVPVLLDSYGQAFIDKNYFDQEKHRDDLNKSEYNVNINHYVNNIWQHTGSTTNNFINGYFYKCTKTSYTIKYDENNSPYLIGSQIGTKLEKYIYDNGLQLDLSKRFLLFVQSKDFIPSTQINDTKYYVKISDVNTFYLTNIDKDGNVDFAKKIKLTKEQLQDVLDISIKTSGGWDTALVKDYDVSIMEIEFELNSSNYAWKQWDVQPRTGVGSAIQYVSNSEIDYLFETHVINIALSEEELELSVGDSHILSVTINPSDASNKTVSWTSSDPSVISIVKTAQDEAKITVGIDAKRGENYTITCTSVSDETKTATCSIKIVG